MSEIVRTLMIADLAGYTALTETHGAMHASEVVLRFGRMADESLEPGVVIVDRIGDQVLCAGADAHAVLRTLLRLCARVEHEPGFLGMQAGIHQGAVVAREGRLFGSPLNITARLAAHAREGQILCTERIAGAAGALPGVSVRALGERRFRNVSSPVGVFELLRRDRQDRAPATDPVCRMQVEIERAAASMPFGGATYHFCSAECAGLFSTDPERYLRS